jgi:hypothetical protein
LIEKFASLFSGYKGRITSDGQNIPEAPTAIIILTDVFMRSSLECDWVLLGVNWDLGRAENKHMIKSSDSFLYLYE